MGNIFEAARDFSVLLTHNIVEWELPLAEYSIIWEKDTVILLAITEIGNDIRIKLVFRNCSAELVEPPKSPLSALEMFRIHLECCIPIKEGAGGKFYSYLL